MNNNVSYNIPGAASVASAAPASVGVEEEGFWGKLKSFFGKGNATVAPVAGGRRKKSRRQRKTRRAVVTRKHRKNRRNNM